MRLKQWGKRNKNDGARKKAENDKKYLYVGVSPQGRYGYNYWYIDEEKQTRANTFVWVRMGRRNIEQMVYVDSVRYCDENEVPYPIDGAKRVIRQATEEESAAAKVLWEERNI